LNQFGILYGKMGQLEEAAVFYRQAADKYLEIDDMKNEGLVRSNLADTLLQLNRPHEARRELQRALTCKEPYGHAAEPWKTWAILCRLETTEGNSAAATAARRQAVHCYLAYRRAGGENYSGGGRLCLQFRQALESNQREAMAALLEEYFNAPKTLPQYKLLIRKLQALLAGSRDPGIAEDEGLFFMDAAELMLLLEAMEDGN